MSFPIEKILPQIILSAKKNNLTLVSTPTGSGKTLLVPASIEQELNTHVYVTMPRVLLAKRAAQSVDEILYGSNYAGVMTSKINKNKMSLLQFCTEGSFINRVSLKREDILIIDEVHEQGVNTEMCLYLAKEHIKNNGHVILMSATFNMEKYVKYFSDALNMFSYEAFTLPQAERRFQVKTIMLNKEDIFREAIYIGGNMLIGVAGKSEIEGISLELRQEGFKGEIFPIHAEIESEDENTAFSFQGKKAYIATSVAMSGITFPDVDIVIPPLKGKRIEQGILSLYDLSLAELAQWEGRVGRVKKGLCILPNLDFSSIEKTPTPEILRKDISEVVCLFASLGVDLNSISLLNQPSKDNIHSCQEFLIKNNILDKNKSSLTGLGKSIISLGEGLEIGLLIQKGIEVGIEATSRKIASLVKRGTPFRKARDYTLLKRIQQLNKLAKDSEHLSHMLTIEECRKDFERNAHEGFIKYAKENSIFLKGLKSLWKDFEWIDNNYSDQVELSDHVLNALFSNQLTCNTVENGYSLEFEKVINENCYPLMYCTLAPIQTRSGRLPELCTKINQRDGN